MEYGILGIATAALAGVLGTLAGYLILTRVMHQDWQFLPGAVLSTALIATALTLCVGYVGTWRALGAKAAPFLRNE
jgi:putative ABC transport system permease protein